MSINYRRIAPRIYYICYEGQIGWSDLKEGQTELYHYIDRYGELDDKYIIIYERKTMSYQFQINFSNAKAMLQQTPKLRADDSIFIGFPKTLQAITSWMHKLLSKEGDVHFVSTLDNALNLAYALLGAQGMDGVAKTPT